MGPSVGVMGPSVGCQSPGGLREGVLAGASEPYMKYRRDITSHITFDFRLIAELNVRGKRTKLLEKQYRRHFITLEQ